MGDPPNNGLPSLGDAIRRRRELLGLTRLQLSLRLGWGPGERTGWSPRTLVRIENGERPLAHPGELVHLARALEMSEAELLGLAPGGPPQTPPPARGGPTATGDGVIAEALQALLAGQHEQTALLQRIAATLEARSPRRGG